jgi:hypothetical protein
MSLDQTAVRERITSALNAYLILLREGANSPLPCLRGSRRDRVLGGLGAYA